MDQSEKLLKSSTSSITPNCCACLCVARRQAEPTEHQLQSF